MVKIHFKRFSQWISYCQKMNSCLFWSCWLWHQFWFQSRLIFPVSSSIYQMIVCHLFWILWILRKLALWFLWYVSPRTLHFWWSHKLNCSNFSFSSTPLISFSFTLRMLCFLLTIYLHSSFFHFLTRLICFAGQPDTRAIECKSCCAWWIHRS